MAAIANARDLILQATSPRIIPLPGTRGITLVSDTLVFKVTTGGVATPTSANLTASLLGVSGTVTFTVTAGTATLTGSGLTRSFAYASMGTETVEVTASITYESVTYESKVRIAKVRDGNNGSPGSPGSDGTRGTVDIIHTSGGLAAWNSTTATNAIITATGTGPIIGDRITLRNTTSNPTYIETRAWGGSWLTIGDYIDGNLIVNGTIAGSAIVTNSITLDRIISNTYGGVAQSIGFTGGVYRTSGNFQILSPLSATVGSFATPNYISSTIMNGSWSFPNGTLNLGTTDVYFQKTTGSPPFAVSSTTQVNNLKAQYAGTADYATSAGSAGYATSAGSAGYASSAAMLISCQGGGSANASGGGFYFTTTVAGLAIVGTSNNVQFNAVSDRRLKKAIKSEILGLDFILKLKPVTYKYRHNDRMTHHGFIYQDVKKLFPNSGDNEGLASMTDGVGGVDYMSMVAPLVKAIQELKLEIDKLKVRNDCHI